MHRAPPPVNLGAICRLSLPGACGLIQSVLTALNDRFYSVIYMCLLQWMKRYTSTTILVKHQQVLKSDISSHGWLAEYPFGQSRDK